MILSKKIEGEGRREREGGRRVLCLSLLCCATEGERETETERRGTLFVKDFICVRANLINRLKFFVITYS
jgi:hypothetical protein